MIITRQHMIDAAKTEPLYNGQWVVKKESNFDPAPNILGVKFDDNNCPVCLVGGTLRQAGAADGLITRIADGLTELGFICFSELDDCEEDIEILIKDGLYLNALSCFFESSVWSTREEIVKWIEDKIPENATYDTEKV